MIRALDYKNLQGVYLITSPNGQFYVGSSVDLYGRLRAHKTYFSKNCRDYKKIKWDCSFEELEVKILKLTQNKTSKQLKKIENQYLELYWSDLILNKEKKSTGRDITESKNPNWRGGKVDKTCQCGKVIKFKSKRCYSCNAKFRHRNGNTDKNKRFLSKVEIENLNKN